MSKNKKSKTTQVAPQHRRTGGIPTTGAGSDLLCGKQATVFGRRVNREDDGPNGFPRLASGAGGFKKASEAVAKGMDPKTQFKLFKDQVETWEIEMAQVGYLKLLEWVCLFTDDRLCELDGSVAEDCPYCSKRDDFPVLRLPGALRVRASDVAKWLEQFQEAK